MALCTALAFSSYHQLEKTSEKNKNKNYKKKGITKPRPDGGVKTSKMSSTF